MPPLHPLSTLPTSADGNVKPPHPRPAHDLFLLTGQCVLILRQPDVIQLVSDGEEAPIEPLEFAAGFLVGEAAPVHLQQMACSRQCSTDSQRVGDEGVLGGWKRRQTVALCRILAGQVELALQVLLGDLEIAQGHPDLFMALMWPVSPLLGHAVRQIKMNLMLRGR